MIMITITFNNNDNDTDNDNDTGVIAIINIYNMQTSTYMQCSVVHKNYLKCKMHSQFKKDKMTLIIFFHTQTTNKCSSFELY